MSKKPVNEPPRKKSLAQEFLIPGLVFGGAIIVALVVLLFGDKLTGPGTPSAAVGPTISNEAQQKFTQEFDKLGVSTGPQDAKLVVREFADYQCPACGAFAPTVQKVREEYADTGKLRLVFFDFPLNVHQNSKTAAAAARCAARQDAFWPFHEKLFESQRRWSGQSDPTDTFLDLAVESGVSVAPFEQCLEQGATDEVVTKNGEIAREVGINSTPTLIIGNKVLSGVTSFDKVKAEIEKQLAAQE